MGKIPQQAIFELLAAMPGIAGLYVENLDDGEIFEVNPTKVFPSASVIKIPILGLLLRDAQEGKIDLNAPRKLKSENRVSGTGILYELNEDYAPPLFYLAKLMIVLSDNAATNEVIDAVGGFERVTAFCREMGYQSMSLNRKMMDWEAIKHGRNNYMASGETGRLLSLIAKGEFVNAEASKTIIDTMALQQCRNKLPSLVPAVPSYALAEDKKNIKPGSVLVANKTGDLFGIQHDVGIFTLPDGRRFIIAMFTSELVNDNDGISTIAKVAKVVYEALK